MITLLVLTLLITLILEFNSSMRIEARAAANFRDDVKAYELAKAGVIYAEAVLEEDARDAETGKYDSLTDLWAQKIPAMPAGDGFVSVEITDENGKIALNKMTAKCDDISAPTPPCLLTRFLEPYDQEDLANAILDWIDPNDDETSPGGAESSYYEGLDDPYAAKNAPLDSIEEIRLIKGMEDGIFKQLRDFFTVYGEGLININTASPKVLMAFSDALGEAAIGEILTSRMEAPFEEKIQVRNVIGEDLYNKISPLIDVKSNFFSVKSRGDVNGVQKTVHAVVERTGNKTSVRYWRVE